MLTALLLSLVAYQAGLFTPQGRSVFAGMFTHADLELLVYAVLFGIVVNLISAYKWYLLSCSQNLGAGFWRIFVYYVVGQFYNMFLLLVPKAYRFWQQKGSENFVAVCTL